MKIQGWMIIVTFVYFISSAISLFIPLKILELHGNSFDVVTSITGYIIVSVFFSLVAGELTQKREKPRFWITLSLISTLLVEISMLFLSSIVALIIEYCLISLTLTLGSPSINLYVMHRERGIFSTFGSYSLLGILGSIFAYIPGEANLNLTIYLYVVIGVTLFSIILAHFILEDLVFTSKIKKEHKRHFAILNSLSYFPYLFTSLRMIKHLQRTNRKELEFSLLMWSIMLYTAGIYVFGSPYIPYLNSHGLNNASIFWIYMFGSIGNIIIYLLFAFNFKISSIKSYKLSLLFRFLGYAPIAIVAFISAYTFFVNSIGYFLIGISYSFWNVSASVEVFKLIRKMDAARKSGIWASLTGGISAIASELSSPIYSYLGFTGNVIIAGLLIFSSYIFFEKAESVVK